MPNKTLIHKSKKKATSQVSKDNNKINIKQGYKIVKLHVLQTKNH